MRYLIALLLASAAHAAPLVQPQDIAYSSHNLTGLSIGTTTIPAQPFQVYSSSMQVLVSTQGAFDVQGGTVPSLSGCGASPTVSAGSDCERGTLTMGSGAASGGCVLAFPGTCFANTPKCVMSCGGQGSLLACGQKANSTIACDTVTTGAAAACGTGTFVSWICLGN